MALDYGEISALTTKYYIPKLVDQVFNSNSLLQRMKKGKMYKAQEGGTAIIQPVMYAVTTAAGWYTGTDLLNTTANDQISAASFTRAQAYANITITHTDELDNSGKSQILDFVKSKVQAAEMTLSHNLGTGVFNLGTDTKAIIGLRLAVDSAGTYGGISRTDYSWWSAQEDGSTTTLTMAALQSLYGDCSVGNDKPTVAITTQDLYDVYLNLLTPMQRFVDEDTARGGFTNVMFNQLPVIVDSHCTALHWYFLNEKYITLFYHPRDDMRFESFVKPNDQQVASAKILWAGQMVCSNPRMQGKFNALAA